MILGYGHGEQTFLHWILFNKKEQLHSSSKLVAVFEIIIGYSQFLTKSRNHVVFNSDLTPEPLLT
ncbi:hypothetical protein PIROE2DRAFT_4820 [Piromyces sp. E2]|nr:hypothetical protein PIROE2DRAFT_4820 [Piromyces sp. E2]|eukprot:OUM67653.1 hypothetical protein PIROE2DRAFT_4820 [Piromyces sp. E2]